MQPITSPFPGMDPFVESLLVFRDFHDRFLSHLSEALQSMLPPPYYASLGQRAWIEMSQRYVGPDVNVARVKSLVGPIYSVTDQNSDIAPKELTEPIVVRVPYEEFSESLVEIYLGRGDERRLVTAIELLSVTNKTQGEKGRELYLKKQSELLDSQTHLIEIDLLRSGLHTTAVPEPCFRKHAAEAEYHVCTHYFDHFGEFHVYPIMLADQLPTIAVPLMPQDGRVAVSLQQVFTRTYAAGAYDRQIDYAGAVPEPKLNGEKQQWVHSILAVQAKPEIGKVNGLESTA